MGWGYLFSVYRDSLFVFLKWVYGKFEIWVPIGKILWGCPYLFFFGRGSAKAAFLTPSERESLRSIHKNDPFLQNDLETIYIPIKMIERKSGFQNFFRYKGVDKN